MIKSPHRPSIIYALHADNGFHNWLVKIGRTKNMKNRLSNIQNGCPYKLNCWIAFQSKNVEEDEKIVHKIFSEFRLRGEWFDLSNEGVDILLDYFRKMQIIYRESIKNG